MWKGLPLLVLLISSSTQQLLPPGRPNLPLATPKEFPNGVVVCGSTFCDEEKCVKVIGQDGSKTYKCSDG